MKKLSVVLVVLMLGTAILTGCSGQKDTLARSNRETQAQWGLVFDEDSAVKESESEEAIPETEEAATTVTKLDNGVKLLELENTEIRIMSTVNVRSGPGTDFDKLGGLAESEIVTMKGICDNGWAQINFDSETGYVFMEYVETVDESVSLDSLLEQIKAFNEEESSGDESSRNETDETGSTDESIRETSGNEIDEEDNLAWAVTDVNVRKGPKASYEVIGQLNQGQSVKVLDSSDAWWWKVEFEGQEAYISVQYLTTERPEE